MEVRRLVPLPGLQVDVAGRLRKGWFVSRLCIVTPGCRLGNGHACACEAKRWTPSPKPKRPLAERRIRWEV